MNPMLALAVLVASPGAPVPKEPPPNPLGWSYMGVRVANAGQVGGPMQIDEPLPGTPAQKAGLRAGDVLVKVGRVEPACFDEVIRYIFELRPGTVIAVQVRRGDQVVTVPLTLAERPNTADYHLPDFIARVNPNPPDDDE